MESNSLQTKREPLRGSYRIDSPPAAFPGRNRHPCFTDEQIGPQRGIPGPQSQQARGRAAVCQDSDAKSQIPSSLSISPSSPPCCLRSLRLCFGNVSPVRVDQFTLTDPRPPVQSAPSPLAGPAASPEVSPCGWCVHPQTQGQKPTVLGRRAGMDVAHTCVRTCV